MWSPKKIAIVAGVVLVGGWYVKKQAGQALATVGTAINPTSDQNLAYKGVNSVGEALTGEEGFRLGAWWYDVVNDDPDPFEQPLSTRPDRQGL